MLIPFEAQLLEKFQFFVSYKRFQGNLEVLTN